MGQAAEAAPAHLLGGVGRAAAAAAAQAKVAAAEAHLHRGVGQAAAAGSRTQRNLHHSPGCMDTGNCDLIGWFQAR